MKKNVIIHAEQTDPYKQTSIDNHSPQLDSTLFRVRIDRSTFHSFLFILTLRLGLTNGYATTSKRTFVVESSEIYATTRPKEWIINKLQPNGMMACIPRYPLRSGRIIVKQSECVQPEVRAIAANK